MPLPPDLEEERKAKAKEAEVFSFDMETMQKHILQDEQHSAILRAQLYLEHVIISIISEALPLKGELDLRRLSFPTKVDICVALGCIPPDWRPVINKVNDYRNKVAHKLDVEIGQKERDELWALVPEILKEYAAKNLTSADAKEVSLCSMLELLVVWLDIWRQKAAVRRVFGDMVSKYAKRVLGRDIETAI